MHLSDVGGIPEQVKDQYNGILFPPDDVERLRDILSELANNPLKIFQLAKHISVPGSIGEYAIKWEFLYNEVIKMK